ncbi:MAG: hypothetical protein HXX11_19040 [Desulfuromonadales bacterium]|nr:hypothetical protein [Desulfuromonadales bacterium]
MKLTCLFIGLMLMVSYDAGATFFKYKDSSGAVVITDKLENVPKKYRNQFKVIWDADLEAKDPLERRKAAAWASQQKREQEQEEERKKAAEKKKSSDGKRLVITIDEETGQLIRTME